MLTGRTKLPERGKAEKCEKTRLKGLLRAFLLLTALFCLPGCTRPETPSERPTEAAEGELGSKASVSALGFEAVRDDPDILLDGDRETGLVVELGPGRSGELIIDLGAVYRIGRVDVFPGKAEGYLGRNFPRKFELSLSVNGKKYETVCEYKNVDAPDCVPVLEFTPADARYVKLTVIDGAAYEGKTVAEIAEIVVVSAFGEYAYPDVIPEPDPEEGQGETEEDPGASEEGSDGSEETQEIPL